MKGLQITGGLLVFFGLLLSLFINFFGWWVLTDRTEYVWITALGGIRVTGDENPEYFDTENSLLIFICGLLVLTGAIFAFTMNKKASILGGSLALVGSLLFMILLMAVPEENSLNQIFALAWNGIDKLVNPFYQEFPWMSGTIPGFLGVGWYMTLGGGLLTLIGGVKEE